MLNVAIVCGGDSGEYDISVKSGEQVLHHLDREEFTPFLILINRKGWLCRIDGHEIPVDKNNFTIHLDGKVIRFDVIFNAIHGTPGEDGKLQGYFDMIGIPYTSSGVTTSALTFNKSFCKQVVASMGLKQLIPFIFTAVPRIRFTQFGRKLHSLFRETKQWRIQRRHVKGHQGRGTGTSITKSI